MRDGRSGSFVLIAEGYPVMRDGMRMLLAAEPNLSICGEADTAEGVRLLVRERRPDLVILDFDLPGGNGLALLEELRSLSHPPRVLIFAGTGPAEGQAEQALRLGASAFVSKRGYGDELLRSVRDVLDGQTILGDAVIQRLVRQRSSNGQRRRMIQQ